ncbi:Uncharacterised protein [Mycobacterium tuberculosis]|nr:Uncharacterised protein [Mycobacterium tuberculosis]
MPQNRRSLSTHEVEDHGGLLLFAQSRETFGELRASGLGRAVRDRAPSALRDECAQERRQ